MFRSQRTSAFTYGHLLLAVAMLGACSAGSTQPATSSPQIVTPSSAYGPFPYQNPAQRSSFAAYLTCAADFGVEYQGPFADSTGKSIFFRLAPGQTVNDAVRKSVDEHCPQMIVGLFATTLGRFDADRYEHAATRFTLCLRSHGYPGFPLPSFGHGDPHDAFGRLPIDWASDRFAAAVGACVEPLRNELL